MNIFTILCALLLVGVVGCVDETKTSNKINVQQLSYKLSANILRILEDPETITAYTVRPDFTNEKGYILSQDQYVLTEEQALNLQRLLLNDDSYIHEHTKLSLFIPTYAFEFTKDNKKLLVLCSPSSQQIRIILQDAKPVVVDIDPLKDRLEILFNAITETENS
jgi:hypothetical protein